MEKQVLNPGQDRDFVCFYSEDFNTTFQAKLQKVAKMSFGGGVGGR